MIIICYNKTFYDIKKLIVGGNLTTLLMKNIYKLDCIFSFYLTLNLTLYIFGPVFLGLVAIFSF